jgi:hypothetical protein
MVFMCLTPFKVGEISEFYHMREVCKQGEGKFIGIQVSVYLALVWLGGLDC